MLTSLIDPSLILSIIIIFLAIKNRNSYPTQISKLSSKAKVLFMIFIFICVPVILFPIYVASMAYYVNHTDYWYKKATRVVNFHLYAIKPPAGLVIDSLYTTGTSFAPDLDNAVQTVLNVPLQEQFSGLSKGTTSVIIVKQVGVDKDFDMEKFIKQTSSTSSSIRFNQVEFSPTGVTAYLGQIHLGNINPQFLYFVTPDHTLVSISSPKQPVEILFQVANSFFPAFSLNPSIITPTVTSTPTLIPTRIVTPTATPTIITFNKTSFLIATPSVSTKFSSSGTKTLEAGITAQITSASVQGNTLVIDVTFTNTGLNSQDVAVVRLSMYSQTLGISDKENIFSLPLSSGQSRSLTLSYDQIANPPYTWKYATLSGGSIVLGTYTP